MPAKSVQVTFGANIQALVEGVEGVKSSLQSLIEPVKAIGEAFAAAFAVDKVAGFIEKYADIGEQIERTSAILGTSAKQTQELGFISQATGGDTQSLTMAMERLQVNLAAAQNPTSRQALALKSLGLSAKELLGVPLPEQLNRIADAASKFAPGGNLTADILTLMGRGAAGMLPALEKGRAGLDELRQSAEGAGAIMSTETVSALARMHVEITTLQASVTALAGTLVAKLGDALGSVGNSITTVLGNINAIISADRLWQEELEGISYAVLSLASSLINMGLIAKDVFTLNWSEISAQWQAGTESQENLLRQHLYNLGKIVLEAKGQIQGQLGDLLSTKPQAPAMAVPNRDAIAAQMEQFQTQIKLYDAAYKQTQEILAGEAKLHQITYDKETQLLLQALDRRHTEEIAALNQESQIAGLTAAQYQKLTDQKLLLDQKWRTEHDKIVIAAAERDAKEWQAALTPFTSAFDAQLRGLLSGTESWATATKRIIQDLVIDGIKYLEKLAIEKAAVGLTSLTGGGPSSLLGGLLGGGQAAGAAALQTGALTLQTGAATLLTAATTLQAATGASALAAGGGAAGAAAGGGGFLAGFASLFKLFAIPGFALGTNYVMRSGLAMIHEGESIGPARGSGPYSGAPGGGTVNHYHNWNISNVDGASFQSWLTRGGTLQIMRAINSASPLNPGLT